MTRPPLGTFLSCNAQKKTLELMTMSHCSHFCSIQGKTLDRAIRNSRHEAAGLGLASNAPAGLAGLAFAPPAHRELTCDELARTLRTIEIIERLHLGRYSHDKDSGFHGAADM